MKNIIELVQNKLKNNKVGLVSTQLMLQGMLKNIPHYEAKFGNLVRNHRLTAFIVDNEVYFAYYSISDYISLPLSSMVNQGELVITQNKQIVFHCWSTITNINIPNNKDMLKMLF